MTNVNVITLSRKQLYDEVWTISVQGVAKKYNLHYQQLLNSCKEANIPIPPSGYWTKLKCGKDVSQEVTELPQSDMENVTLYLNGFKPEKYKKEETKQSESEDIEDKVCDEAINSGKNDSDLQEDDIESIVDSSTLFFHYYKNKDISNIISQRICAKSIKTYNEIAPLMK